jgi:GDP-D-mannose dehydratase
MVRNVALITGVTGQDGSCLADLLLGTSTKARTRLRWRPRVPFDQLVEMMVDSDLMLAEQEQLLGGEGHTVLLVND